MSLERAFNRVFITGIEGFTGRALREYLSNRGYTISGSSIDDIDGAYRVDITDIDSIREALNEFKPDIIIHLAAISFVAHSNNEDFYRVNCIGSENILKASSDIDSIKRVILASSASVYGRREEPILDETLCPRASNHYGASKYSAERIASNYLDRLSIIVTRPFNYTGVGQSENFLIPKIVKHYAKGKKSIELGNIDVIREFNDIDFVSEAYARLIEIDDNSLTVNICSGRGIALIDIIKIMNKIAGYEIEIKVNPKFVRKDDIKKVVGSPDRLYSKIGKITPKPLEEMLQELYNSYR